jgi:hypothetical protein
MLASSIQVQQKIYASIQYIYIIMRILLKHKRNPSEKRIASVKYSGKKVKDKAVP